MLLACCGERALPLVSEDIPDLVDYDDGTAIRALGALCLGNRTLAGLCWREAGAVAETGEEDGEMVPLFERATCMREAYEDYLARAERATETW